MLDAHLRLRGHVRQLHAAQHDAVGCVHVQASVGALLDAGLPHGALDASIGDQLVELAQCVDHGGMNVVAGGQFQAPVVLEFLWPARL